MSKNNHSNNKHPQPKAQDKTPAATPAPVAAAVADTTTSAMSAAPKRTTRLPLQAVQEALMGQEFLVPDLAKKLDIGERDIRLAIDRLRSKGIGVVRTALRTFTIPAKQEK